MNLRTRAVALSILPMALTLFLALPEGVLQWQVIQLAAQSEQAAQAASTARNVTDARVAETLALRRMLNGEPQVAGAFERTRQGLIANATRLVALADDAKQDATARRIVVRVRRLQGLIDKVVRAYRTGAFRLAAALHAAPLFDRSIDALQQDVAAYVVRAHDERAAQRIAIDALWRDSLVILVVALFGMAAVSIATGGRASRFASAMMRLVEKVACYRRDEELGARSERTDEIGVLDAALHDLVAEQREREYQLRSYRLLSDVTRDIILFVDRINLTVIEANAAASLTYGYSRSEMAGKHCNDLSTVELPWLEVLAAADSEEGLSCESMHRRSDGSTFPVEIRARTASIDERSLIAVTIRDVSERHRAAEHVSAALAEALRASRLKSEFVATMSHELRTPMQSVIGMNELLFATSLTERQRECAEAVRDSAQALLETINDILDFSKLEAGKVELDAVSFDPAAVLTGALGIVRGTVLGKPLVIASETVGTVPSCLHGDPARLRQVLVNLLGNAAKFTDRGLVNVTMATAREDESSVQLAFTVTDTGIGVSAQARTRLFQPFVQGDGSTTRPFGGSGLGLSISRQLVELMGGEIWLRDDVGPGATFCFTVRFERARMVEDVDAVDSGGDKVLHELAPSTKGGPRLLLVEDNALVRRVVGFQLEELGHAVDVVAGGRAALAATDDTAYDLILMDMHMPDLDGLEVTRRLRRGERDRGRRATIVALTANSLEGDRAACRDAGMDDFLSKPLRIEDLRVVLDRWLVSA
jgi:PAS domain S-box-containing protein